ncbi:MAG: hypothetical protein LQ345_002697 [Seirophora villosa]|nr:MAG: hypothetical protein LQ345_002697 [Seirophora villosa]
MFIKLSATLVGALAVAARAGPHYGQHYGLHKRHYTPSVSAYGNQTSSLPVASSSLGNSPTEPSSAPLETFPTIIPDATTSVPVGTGSSAVPTIPLSTGATANPSIPLTTGVSSTLGNSPVETGDHTLTYTLGSGSSTTVVTTTIKQTSTETNVNTVYATSGSEAEATGGSGAEATGGSEGGDEPTTTLTSTSTKTQTKTIVPVSSGLGNSPAGASGSGNCPTPVTVTVTGSPVTVTVTADSGPSGPASSGLGDSPISSSAPYAVSSSNKPKKKCPTASTGFITTHYPSFTSNPSASITFAHPTGTGAVKAGEYL